MPSSRPSDPTRHQPPPIPQEPSKNASTTGLPPIPTSRSAKPKPRTSNSKSDYIDTIDQLDVSGLNLGGFHHSGPYDVFNKKGKNPAAAPIAAFSSSALDASLTGSSGGTYPLRESYAPPSRGRTGGSNGLSARAKAALSAMDDENTAPAESSEYLLAYSPNTSLEGLSRDSDSSSRRSRRNSEGSVTLGYPSSHQAKSAKERQYIETFGIVESEAFEDFGRGAQGKWKDPRISMYPTDLKSNGSATSQAGSSNGKPGLTPKDLRAARTASIWDMEATLRAGRPVGAAGPPPPMPVIPNMYLSPPSGSNAPFTDPTSSSQTDQPIKRSKSLMSRMRGKKSGRITDPPSPVEPLPAVHYFDSEPPALPSKSPTGEDTPERKALTNAERDYDLPPPPPSGSSLEPVRRPKRNGSLSPAPAVAPIPLPTPDEISFNSSMSSSTSSRFRPHRHARNEGHSSRDERHDGYLADESATAAVLASSSSEKSDLAAGNGTSGSENDLSYYQTSGGGSGIAYDEDSKEGNYSSSTPDASFDASYDGSGNRLNRKPSLAKRWLGGRGAGRK